MLRSQSTVRVSRQEKIARLAAKLAIQAAKSAHDPLYTKYKALREKYLAAKLQLIRKYRNVARRKLREALMKSK